MTLAYTRVARDIIDCFTCKSEPNTISPYKSDVNLEYMEELQKVLIKHGLISFSSDANLKKVI